MYSFMLKKKVKEHNENNERMKEKETRGIEITAIFQG